VSLWGTRAFEILVLFDRKIFLHSKLNKNSLNLIIKKKHTPKTKHKPPLMNHDSESLEEVVSNFRQARLGFLSPGFRLVLTTQNE